MEFIMPIIGGLLSAGIAWFILSYINRGDEAVHKEVQELYDKWDKEDKLEH
jgi:phosphate/sulfate permease